jgi:hypothetical protein
MPATIFKENWFLKGLSDETDQKKFYQKFTELGLPK